MKKKLFMNIIKIFPILFLPAFMILIFGPAEIFFSNVSEFGVIYSDFAGYLALAAFGGTAALSILLAFFGEKLRKVFLSITFTVSLAGYLQTMFLNHDLDMLGANPKGYQVRAGSAALNLLIWIAVLATVLWGAFRKEELWKKAILYGSGFLIAIQCVALVSLVATAKEEAFYRNEEKAEYHFSGAEQFTVSAKENVIILLLDYCSNEDLELAQKVYPDVVDALHDFTYYDNVDCNYFGTFPSFPHFLTGKDVDMTKKVDEWFAQIWADEDTRAFYEMLHERNYKTNLFIPEKEYICGSQDVEILKDDFSNIVNSGRRIDVFYKLLFKTISKMACFRMAPELAKPLFYTRGDEYGNIVSYADENIYHNNYDFYANLQAKGLKTDRKSNYIILQHLMGAHEYTTDQAGRYVGKTTMEETIKGCMVIVEEYLNCLKKEGVYDSSTIIVTSDHGDMRDSQVIFFLKEAGEKREQMAVSHAPASLSDLRATIAYEVGEDPSRWGNCIHDYGENEQRERLVWVRGGIEGYPLVPHYVQKRTGNANVYRGYYYTGDRYDLYRKFDEGPDIIVPLIDCFW